MDDATEPMNKAALTNTISAPVHATSLAYSGDGSTLVVGSDDGSARFYRPPEHRVYRAVRGLVSPVADVAFLSNDDSDLIIASGKRAFKYSFEPSNKLIYSATNASDVFEIGEDDEDTINKLASSANKKYIACTTDSGGVHVLEVATKEITTMKTKHQSIAWNIVFIPDRPNELLSGGYDCSLLLFDFRLGTLLTRFEFQTGPPPAVGLASAPPFITALALSPRGAVAAGCADGRVWIGLGGEKPPISGNSNSTKKRSRKWAGLSEDEGSGFFAKVDAVMIAALYFVSPNELVSVSINGKISWLDLVRPDRTKGIASSARARTVWIGQAASCAKIEALAFHGENFTVAGLHTDHKRGAIEIWKTIGR